MDVSPKKQLLNKIAEHSRKRYHSMDCKKKEKHLNKKRNQLAIARQTRKISKLNVDICISQFCQKIKLIILSYLDLIMYALSVTGCFIENLY